MFEGIISIDNLPKLDLHGEIGDISRVMIYDFIRDNIKLKNKYVVIIHGKGSLVVKKVTYEVIKNNKDVLDYKLCYYNDGATILKLNTL